ncbi:hypothetical protein V6Z11_D03G086600 [Gossypium hirsutum]
MSPFASFADSGEFNTCFISSSSKWVIDFGATDHMTGNPNLFTFQSPNSPFLVTIDDGSTYKVVNSRTINRTSFIILSSVSNLPNLAFNLIFFSELTHDQNCYITFFFPIIIFYKRTY